MLKKGASQEKKKMPLNNLKTDPPTSLDMKKMQKNPLLSLCIPLFFTFFSKFSQIFLTQSVDSNRNLEDPYLLTKFPDGPGTCQFADLGVRGLI